jgi:chromosome segregation ATPase
MGRVRRTLLCGVLVASASGCFASSEQHAALERRVVDLDRRVHTMEAAEHDRQAQLQRADEQVRALNAQLEQARTQTRNLADLGARLDGIDEQIRTIRGSNDEVRRTIETSSAEESTQRQEIANRLTALEQRLRQARVQLGLDQPDPNDIPQNPNDIIVQLRRAVTLQSWDRVRLLAQAFLQRAPTDPNADDAQLSLAQSYANQQRNATAVQEYQRLLTTYPNSELIPQSLSEMAEALVRLRMCVPAQRALRLLVDRYRNAPQTPHARRRLDEVQHLPATACESGGGS